MNEDDGEAIRYMSVSHLAAWENKREIRNYEDER
jgi:hypothetical protein